VSEGERGGGCALTQLSECQGEDLAQEGRTPRQDVRGGGRGHRMPRTKPVVPAPAERQNRNSSPSSTPGKGQNIGQFFSCGDHPRSLVSSTVSTVAQPLSLDLVR